MNENGSPNFASFSAAAVPDDGVIRLTCEVGHETHTIVQEDRFELLSELALIAILEGYHREAVASFQASLERLHEFFLRTVWISLGVEDVDAIAAWKLISNQSERQLGAFVATYLAQNGEVPPMLPQPMVELRNAVIHKGKFPTEAEAIAFGQAVADVAKIIMSELKGEKYAPSLQTLILMHVGKAYQAAREVGAHPATLGTSTFFSIASAVDDFDVRKSLADRAKRPDYDKAVEEAGAFAKILKMVQTGAIAG